MAKFLKKGDLTTEELIQIIQDYENRLEDLNNKIKSAPLPIITLYVDEEDVSVVWNTLSSYQDGENISVKVYKPETSQEIMVKTGVGRRAINGLITWSTEDLLIRPSAPVNMLIETMISTDPNQKYYSVLQFKKRTTSSEITGNISTHISAGRIQGRIIS